MTKSISNSSLKNTYPNEHFQGRGVDILAHFSIARLISIFLFIALLISVISLKFVNVNANKNTELSMKKQYLSIQIEEGDSLWSIAEEYMGVGYSSKKEYIKDIKKINDLSSETIHEGAYLIVPQYVAVK